MIGRSTHKAMPSGRQSLGACVDAGIDLMALGPRIVKYSFSLIYPTTEDNPSMLRASTASARTLNLKRLPMFFPSQHPCILSRYDSLLSVIFAMASSIVRRRPDRYFSLKAARPTTILAS